MANETVTKSSRFYCVSLTPDICKTPVGASTPPIPYNIIGEFKEADVVSPNVKAQGEPVFLHAKSRIPTVKGDNPGSAGGIKSGTTGKKVESKTASSTFRVNKLATIQADRQVWMNDRNTVGMVYERGAQAAKPRVQPAAGVVDKFVDALKPWAQKYKNTASDALHQAGSDAMEKGGIVLAGSEIVGLAGAGIAATGVGAPVGAVVEAGAAAGATVGSVVFTTGAVVEGGATLADAAADYILTKNRPALGGLVVDAGIKMLERSALGRAFTLVNRVGKEIPLAKRLLEARAAPGKKPAKMPPPAPPKKPPPPNDGKDGGKTRKQKQEKSDKPSDCCPKNAAPGGKPVSSRHPVHFGTGEEVLYQTDFVIDGPIPLAWTRCYRSGSECEDWGMLGARWSSPYTSHLSVVADGIVYHDDSGRAVRLPPLPPGGTLDQRKEGFTLVRTSADAFVLTWRDGSTEIFELSEQVGWLPHGFHGVNAMLAPGASLRADLYALCRTAGRDGRGATIERMAHAVPGAAMLRVRTDDGLTIEAMREDLEHGTPRIGRVEQVRPDGTRICHVRYAYAAEPLEANAARGDAPFVRLPQRFNLARQTNPAGGVRTYRYRHHLLTAYADYCGFEHGLSWISLDYLRARWADSPEDDDVLLQRRPVTLDNSYQARAIATLTADDCDTVRIAYPNPDTTRVTESGGAVLEYRFDANWLAVEVSRIAPAGEAHPLGRREWDRDGMLLAEIDGAGGATRYAYDTAGNVVSATDALGHTHHMAYDADNQAIAVTDPLGHVTRQAYDAQGRPTEIVDAQGDATRFSYDNAGRLVELTDAKGGVNRFDYDRDGRLIRHRDCSGYATTYRYDDSGRLTEVIDALSQRTQYQYDALGRTTAVVHPDGAEECFDYDAEGRLLSQTDAAGHVTQYRYNGHGLPVERVDALGQSVHYRYDRALRLKELVNGNGDVYRFDYHADGNLVCETGFDGKVTRYEYDQAGELIGSECAGQRTSLLRDRAGRLVAKVNADGTVRFAYDALGRMTDAENPFCNQRFVYDALGRLIEERSAYYLQAQADPANDEGKQADACFVMTHAYDELGNRIRIVLPNGRQVDILRYGSGHWHGMLWQGKPLVDIERDRLHREIQRRYGDSPDDLRMERRYDPQSRLLAMTLQHGRRQDARPMSERRFWYDRLGNLIKTSFQAPDRKIDRDITYGYDPLGRLLSAVQPGLKEAFTFDAADNMIDAPDSQQGNRLTRYQGATYQYDAQGNLRTRHIDKRSNTDGSPDLALEYDADNRLVRAVRTEYASRATARYVYDAFSRRIAKYVLWERWNDERDMCAGGVAQRRVEERLFVWDGDLMTQEVERESTNTYLYEPG